VQQHTQTVNRLHAVLQDANIKLSSVATNILGVSGRDMIEALQRGDEDPTQLAELARGRLRAKIPQLRVALDGLVRDHHRFLLKVLLDQLDQLTATIDQLSHRIEEISPESFRAAVRLVSTADGIQERTAQNVLAETGIGLLAGICGRPSLVGSSRLSGLAEECDGVPIRKNRVTLLRVVSDAGLVLPQEAHRVDPSQRVHQCFESAGAQLRRVCS
jgi:hypothetical protein